MMRKILAGIVVFVLVFALAATPVFAAGHGHHKGGGTGAQTRVNLESCPYAQDCPYDGDCPYDCPNNATPPRDGTGAQRGGSHHAASSSGRSGSRLRDGSCR